MIDIKDKNGNLRYSVEITEKCVYYKSLMEEEYVLLSFESDTVVPLDKGDYIDTEFGLFYIVSLDNPKRSSDGGYTYEQKFHVGWERLRNRLTFYDRQKGSEKSWKMTQKPEYFLDIIVGNIYDAGYGRYGYEIDASLTEMKLVEFDATNIIDALSAVAEAWDTEWWISDNIIHISKCEFGSEVTLQLDDTLSDLEKNDGQDTEYITRLYAFGSTRNLQKNYRKDDSGSTVVEGVVETRLKLPSGIPFVDAWDNMQNEDIVEGVAIFDDIYPRNDGKISTITTKQYTDTIENEDGTTTKEVWNAFRFTDSGIKFSADYVIDGEELRIVFQSGRLAGMDFAVTFNPDGLKETESGCQVFEIVRNEDYGVALPTDDFCPAVGDTYILYGYDTSFVADNLVSKAEEELYEAAKDYVAKTSQDKSVYTCKTNPIRCAGYTENALGKLAYSSSDVIDLDVGQSVKLVDDNFFPSGYRVSRVRSFEKRLDNRYNCTYTVGESSMYSNRENLQEQIDELTYQSKEITNTYGSAIYLVKRYDKTAPTDNNAFSSKRAQYEFLQKNVPDRAKGKIIFEKGIDLGDFQEDEQGGRIDEQGNAELLTLVVRSLLRNARFVSGFNGEGWQLWIDENGLSNLEVDRLTVRQIMRVFELIIDRIRAVGGQIVVSAANGKIKSVEDLGEAYRIKFEGNNYFVEHDLMRCQVFTGDNVRGYWVEVLSVDGDAILVSKSEFEEWGTEPLEGDECVLMGNTENALRQNFISISATEDGQPRIDIMDGVSSKSFTDCLRARFGNLDGISDSWFPADNQPHGNGIYADNAYLRGTFLLTTGEDILTKFSVMEGKIESSIEGLKTDFLKDKGFLANPTFDGFSHWTAENDTVFFLVGNKWIWANDNVLSKQGDGASIITDDGRRVVRIRNKYIKQVFDDLLSVPEIKTNSDGKKEPAAVYLSFYYKVKKAGTLTIGFENVNKDGFVEFETFSVNETLGETETYQQFTASGLWNATGDFELAFTGEIYLYMLVLSTDRVETLTNTYKTLFEQSEKLVKIAAANFDNEGKILESSEIVTTAKYSALISKYFDEDGNLINTSGLVTTSNFAELFAQGVNSNGLVKQADIKAFITKDDFGELISGITLSADQIQLEGIVTANGNFKILEDGSMESVNGTFRGRIEATSGTFAGKDGMYELSFDADNRNIILKGPDDVMSDTDFSPREGAKSYTYITIGNFVWAGSSYDASGECTHSFIAPQIRLQRPLGPEYAEDDGFYVTLDPHNGLVAGYKNTLSGMETRTETIVSNSGIYTDSGFLVIKNLPNSSSLCQEGQLYREGNTIKIKIL